MDRRRCPHRYTRNYWRPRYHLATDWYLYAGEPVWRALATWNGGLGIYGGIVGGAIGVIVWKHFFVKQVSWWKLLDAIAIALPVGQAIGRIGNFLNQELFGLPTTLPWGIFIEPAFRPDAFASSTHFHPLFFYEALPNAILGLGLFALWRWQRTQKDIPFLGLGTGLYVGMYAIWYGIVRFSLDFFTLGPGTNLGNTDSEPVVFAAADCRWPRGIFALFAGGEWGGTR